MSEDFEDMKYVDMHKKEELKEIQRKRWHTLRENQKKLGLSEKKSKTNEKKVRTRRGKRFLENITDIKVLRE